MHTYHVRGNNPLYELIMAILSDATDDMVPLGHNRFCHIIRVCCTAKIWYSGSFCHHHPKRRYTTLAVIIFSVVILTWYGACVSYFYFHNICVSIFWISKKISSSVKRIQDIELLLLICIYIYIYIYIYFCTHCPCNLLSALCTRPPVRT